MCATFINEKMMNQIQDIKSVSQALWIVVTKQRKKKERFEYTFIIDWTRIL